MDIADLQVLLDRFRTRYNRHPFLLNQDLDVRAINAITGELLRDDLTIDLSKDYQPRAPKRKTPEPTFP